MKAFDLDILDDSNHLSDSYNTLKQIHSQLLSLEEKLAEIEQPKMLTELKKEQVQFIENFSQNLQFLTHHYQSEQNTLPKLSALFTHLNKSMQLLKQEEFKQLNLHNRKHPTFLEELKSLALKSEELSDLTSIIRLSGKFCQKNMSLRTAIKNRGSYLMLTRRGLNLDHLESKLEKGESQLVKLRQEMMNASSLGEFKSLEQQLFQSQLNMLKLLKRLERKPRKKK